MLKVSICVPTYNNVLEVKRLVESIKEQTFQEYELIISDDSTNAEIKEYLSLETSLQEKIRYHHNETPLGPIYNWNHALSFATGSLIKIMFSDDWFTYKDSLEKMVRIFQQNPTVGLVFSGSMQVSKQESYARIPQKEYLECLKKDYRYLMISNQIGAPSDSMYRKEIEAKFDEQSNWASDVFLYFEILKKNAKFHCIKEPLISIGMHENQYTYTFTEKDERIFQDYKYMFLKYRLIESEECKEYFKHTYLLKFDKSIKEAKECGYNGKEYFKEKIEFFWKQKVRAYFLAKVRRGISE
ncbi:MAG: glycosyltransferase family 2 protein [Lachnospiraceae bacterium]